MARSERFHGLAGRASRRRLGGHPASYFETLRPGQWTAADVIPETNIDPKDWNATMTTDPFVIGQVNQMLANGINPVTGRSTQLNQAVLTKGFTWHGGTINPFTGQPGRPGDFSDSGRFIGNAFDMGLAAVLALPPSSRGEIPANPDDHTQYGYTPPPPPAPPVTAPPPAAPPSPSSGPGGSGPPPIAPPPPGSSNSPPPGGSSGPPPVVTWYNGPPVGAPPAHPVLIADDGGDNNAPPDYLHPGGNGVTQVGPHGLITHTTQEMGGSSSATKWIVGTVAVAAGAGLLAHFLKGRKRSHAR